MKRLDDYQVVARDYLLGDEKFSALFDEAGVGKTGPAIVAGYEKWKETGYAVLVTAPAYLLSNWEMEIRSFAPGATCVVADGAGQKKRTDSLSEEKTFVLTSYNNWSARDKSGGWTYPILHERKWGALIYDEAHRLRGRNSLCTRHVRELRKRRNPNLDTPLWCLTGTPVVNNPGDLFPLLQLWEPRLFRSYWRFVKEWCYVTETPWSTEPGVLRKGFEDEFRDLLRQFSLRRTLEDIPSLATLEERHTEHYVELPASVRKTIAKAKKEYRLEHPDLDNTEFVAGGGALYAKLRQIATVPPTVAKPKIQFVREYLQDHTRHVVIYCWYRNSARTVAAELTKLGRPVTLISGDVPTGNRKALVDQWNQTADGVLVATISALKEGISLVSASDVLFLEHSELPADQGQCVSRLKRRGQKRLVNVHHVYARGTPDMAIRRAVINRETSIRAALTSWIREEED